MTFEEAHHKFYLRIERFIRHGLDPDDKACAEELAVDVFALLAAKWETLSSHEEDRLLKWLYNAAVIKLRAHRRERSCEPPCVNWEDVANSEEVSEHCVYIDTEAEDARFRAYIEQIKAMLPPGDRETLYYMAERGASVAETAAELHISESAVKVRRYRLRLKLREILAKIL